MPIVEFDSYDLHSYPMPVQELLKHAGMHKDVERVSFELNHDVLIGTKHPGLWACSVCVKQEPHSVLRKHHGVPVQVAVDKLTDHHCWRCDQELVGIFG